MTEPQDTAANGSQPIDPPRVQGEVEPAGERNLPVPAPVPDARPIERGAAPVPAPVVAATGGMVAGFATFVLVRLLRRRRSPRGIGRVRAGRGRELEIASSRSFLVDVHLLKR